MVYLEEIEQKIRWIENFHKNFSKFGEIEVSWNIPKQNHIKLLLIQRDLLDFLRWNKRITQPLPGMKELDKHVDEMNHIIDHVLYSIRSLLRFWSGVGWKKEIRGADLSDFNGQIINLQKLIKVEIELLKKVVERKDVKKTIKADFHIHPILPDDHVKAEKKVKKYWRKIRELGLDLISVTEHANENPYRAYEYMLYYRPQDMHTIVLPGLEIESIENAHVVVFSNFNPTGKEILGLNLDNRIKLKYVSLKNRLKIYNIPELATWRRLTAEQIVNLANRNGLHCYIAHPHQPVTGAFDAVGQERLEKILHQKITGVSVHVGVWERVVPHLKFMLPFADSIKGLIINLFPGVKKKDSIKFSDQLDMMNRTPEALTRNANFHVAESDAHTPEMMGSHIKIPVYSDDFDEIFKAIISNKSVEVFRENKGVSAFGFFKQLIATTMDTVKMATSYRMANKKVDKATTNKLFRAMNDPNSTIEEIIKYRGEIYGGQAILDMYKKLSSEQRVELMNMAHRRYIDRYVLKKK